MAKNERLFDLPHTLRKTLNIKKREKNEKGRKSYVIDDVPVIIIIYTSSTSSIPLRCEQDKFNCNYIHRSDRNGES